MCANGFRINSWIRVPPQVFFNRPTPVVFDESLGRKKDVMNHENSQKTILALLRSALERWCKGDPYGYAELLADDGTYFDHVTETRLDGIAAVKDHVRQFEGKVNIPRFEMPNLKFQFHGNIAVLTFNWYTFSNDDKVTSRWNVTEVYSSSDDQWKMIHAHWAKAQAK